jgi:hypothetical protein
VAEVDRAIVVMGLNLECADAVVLDNSQQLFFLQSMAHRSSCMANMPVPWIIDDDPKAKAGRSNEQHSDQAEWRRVPNLAR